MTEPLADCCEVDARLEKVDRGRVWKRMRMDLFVSQGGNRDRTGGDVFEVVPENWTGC